MSDPLFDNINSEQIRIENQREFKKQEKYLGRIKFEAGHRLWELNLNDRKIREITEFETVADIKGIIRRKFITQENCLYTTALNIRNAEKHFIKMIE